VPVVASCSPASRECLPRRYLRSGLEVQSKLRTQVEKSCVRLSLRRMLVVGFAAKRRSAAVVRELISHGTLCTWAMVIMFSLAGDEICAATFNSVLAANCKRGQYSNVWKGIVMMRNELTRMISFYQLTIFFFFSFYTICASEWFVRCIKEIIDKFLITR